MLPNGYYENGNYYFYLKDHLGNNCVVARGANGSIQQGIHYYPFGKANTYEGYGSPAVQPYKFGGKEEESMFGLGLYDFEARQYDQTSDRFMSIDPLCEKYYWISPYAYCANNPVRFVDPTGMRWADMIPKELETRVNDQVKENTEEINTQEAQMIAEQELNKRSLSEAVWSTHQPQLYATNYVNRDGSLIISTNDGHPNRIERSAPLDEVTIVGKRIHKPGNGTVAVGYNISYGTSAGGLVNVTPIHVVHILKGPDAGKILPMAEATLAGGATLDVSGSIGFTQYGYVGDINNFDSSTFEGQSDIFGQNFGEGVVVGFGETTGQKIGIQGTLTGRTVSIGLGIGSPINYFTGKTYTQPFNK